MRPYFADQCRLDRLERVAQEWVGTPFYPHGVVKGRRGGCSCETLVLSLYIEAGLLPAGMKLPRLSLRTYRVARRSAIGGYMEGLKNFAVVDKGELMPGDMVLFVDERCEHCGVVLEDGRVVHSMIHRGVQISRLDDATFSMRLKRAWRPLEGEV